MQELKAKKRLSIKFLSKEIMKVYNQTKTYIIPENTPKPIKAGLHVTKRKKDPTKLLVNKSI